MTQSVEEENPVPSETDALPNRNFISTTVYQVLLRVGWIFKTESVIMPAALDSMGGAGWVRGCLPMLNRIGQSIPPLLAWPLIKGARRQRSWLAATTFLMGVMFCLLACIWLSGFHQKGAVAQYCFLAIYGLFFIATGINQLTLSSLIGRLFPAQLRGRLMLAANTFGCLASIACAWFVLRHWLRAEDADFFAIFGTSGLCFIVAAASTWLIDEKPETPAKSRYQVRAIFSEVWETFRDDTRFRVVALISAMFGFSMTLTPHYQNFARVKLDLGFSDLLPWLIIQNLGVAVFSVPVGTLADRRGNRYSLRLVFAFLLAAPVLSLVFAQSPSIGRAGFFLVYFLLGLMPVTMRILFNFALEFASTEDQPKYLATQSMAIALPVIASSTLVGALIDRVGFEIVFGSIIALMAVGLLLTFFVHEPRHD